MINNYASLDVTAYNALLYVLHKESEHYMFDSKKDRKIIVTDDKGNDNVCVSMNDFIRHSNGMYTIIETNQVDEDVGCHQSISKSVDKSDIRIIIHDPRTGVSPLLGFSIKSQLGARSTLINAGVTTNVVYKIERIDLTDELINHINSINQHNKMDLRGRVRYIYEQGGCMVYAKYQNDVLCKNLMMIDTLLPEIIQRMLLNFYLTDARTVLKLVETVEQENFIGFDLTEYPSFYRRKVANMLVDSALGMVPKTKWHGEYDATGGYLVVKEDGEVLCYHFYNRNLFEKYLLNNTAFETPGKHELNNFGLVYRKGEDYYMNLELQVRFLK